MITWYITRFLATTIRNKVRHIQGLEYLYRLVNLFILKNVLI